MQPQGFSPKIGGDTEGVEFTSLINLILYPLPYERRILLFVFNQRYIATDRPWVSPILRIFISKFAIFAWKNC